MGWNDIPTGGIIVWLNDLGDSIPWLNDLGAIIPWYGAAVTYAWQQIPTFQVPRWGIRILKWENNSSVVLGWANNAGTQLNWGSNPGNLPVNEPNTFWTQVAT